MLKRSLNCLAALLLLQALACEPELKPGGFEDQSRPDVGGGEGSGDAGGQAEVDFADMEGTWALAVDLSSCAVLFGVTTETRNRTVARVKITQEGLKLSEVHDDCESGNTPIAGLDITVPVATVNSGNPMEVTGVLFGPYPGGVYRNLSKARVWGIELDDPLADPFPTSEEVDDPRIFDADMDGNPGVTLDINGGSCQIYIAQRSIEALRGNLMPDGSIEGDGSLFTLTAFIDATNPLCATPYEVLGNDERGENYFRMVRVDERGLDFDANDDGEVSCEEILVHRDELITFKEPDDARCVVETPGE